MQERLRDWLLEALRFAYPGADYAVVDSTFHVEPHPTSGWVFRSRFNPEFWGWMVGNTGQGMVKLRHTAKYVNFLDLAPQTMEFIYARCP